MANVVVSVPILGKPELKMIYRVMINSQYYRDQFDDYLAGGTIEFNNEKYYWSAINYNNGFGWEIDPIIEDSWNDITEIDFNELMEIIEESLIEHKSEYVFESSL